MKTLDTYQNDSSRTSLINLRGASQALSGHQGLSMGGVGLGDVGVLVGLGLTGRQARVYLAL